MKKIVLCIWIFLFAFNVNAASINTNVTLKSCIDGDTAILNIDNKEVKVRFLAINTPEVNKEEYGNEASKYTCKLLTDAKKITVEYDSKATKDKYDRELVWIWVDDKLLQERLVSEGYAEVAYVYDKYKYAESLCLYQYTAINNKKNIWSNSSREEDYCGGVDLSKVVDIIDYNLVEQVYNNPNYSEEDLEKIVEQIQTTRSKLQDMNKAAEKIDDFMSENPETVSNIILFVILGIAGIYLLLKTIKELK